MGTDATDGAQASRVSRARGRRRSAEPAGELNTPPAELDPEGGGDPGVPKIGRILRSLRQRHGLSLKDVADASGLSISFVSAIEREQSDISLGRLNRLAHVFNQDIGSLLGYTASRSTPQFVTDRDRLVVDRGDGIDYRVFHLPGLDFELITSEFAPRSAFREAITHEGLDIIYVLRGQLVLEYNGEDYPLRSGDCTIYSGAYPHRFRNDSARPAAWLSIVTGIVY